MMQNIMTEYVSPEVEIVHLEASQTILSGNNEQIECDPDEDLCPTFTY